MSKKKDEVVYFDEKGKRFDGRSQFEIRPITLKVGVIERSDGSAYVEWGQNKAIAAVYGPREMLPKHLADANKATIRYYYRMAPFSVPDRKNPKPGRREIEISKVSGEALSHSVDLEQYPNTAIDIFVTIFDSNAGTRITALLAASLALADAGLPMKDLVSGIAVGKAGGKLIADMNKHEEDASDAVDLPIAMLPNNNDIVLLQMDGVLTEKEFYECLDIAKKNCQEIRELQVSALKEKYSVDFNSGD
ncbi:MAG: exosome complex exonuclease Rrp41 [Candidatus Diapherotrites archaeon CG08_land_8_20_14_0_20_30_16]|nr:MAG: exosome complex exonuclease Rrp41 [Candidatus Diapherotrites archaeon CG08_land_8_20_14_0_20_30_16]